MLYGICPLRDLRFLTEMNTMKPSDCLMGVTAVVSERSKRLKTRHYCIAWALLDTRLGLTFTLQNPPEVSKDGHSISLCLEGRLLDLRHASGRNSAVICTALLHPALCHLASPIHFKYILPSVSLLVLDENDLNQVIIPIFNPCPAFVIPAGSSVKLYILGLHLGPSVTKGNWGWNKTLTGHQRLRDSHFIPEPPFMGGGNPLAVRSGQGSRNGSNVCLFGVSEVKQPVCFSRLISPSPNYREFGSETKGKKSAWPTLESTRVRNTISLGFHDLSVTST